MPTELIIMGITYKVIEKSGIDKYNPVFGLIDYVSQTISIEKDMKLERKQLVLSHEIIHAILEQIGHVDLSENETFVQTLGNALYQLIKDNAITF